jgi:hypothetical protein
MVWFDTFGDTFWLAVLAALVGICGVSLKSCLRAKCIRCKLCCGALEVERDIAAELREDMVALETRTALPSAVGASVRATTPRRGSPAGLSVPGGESSRSTFFTNEPVNRA